MMIATDSGKKLRHGSVNQNSYVNLADSGDNIVDFDLSESRYTTNPAAHYGVAETPQGQST